MTSLLNVRTVTINEFNSQDYPQLHLTSETLPWEPATNLYEQQKNAMLDYSENIVCDAAMRGQVPVGYCSGYYEAWCASGEQVEKNTKLK